MRTLIEANIWLGERQVELYKKNPPAYMDAFCNGSGIRAIMVKYYEILTSKGELLHIEVLDIETKKELKKMALEIAAGRMDTAGCIDLCKCLQVLSNQKSIKP